jgi:hypothetical protein
MKSRARLFKALILFSSVCLREGQGRFMTLPTSCSCAISSLPTPTSPHLPSPSPSPYVEAHCPDFSPSHLGVCHPGGGEGGGSRVPAKVSRVGEGRGKGSTPLWPFCTSGWCAMRGRDMWERCGICEYKISVCTCFFADSITSGLPKSCTPFPSPPILPHPLVCMPHLSHSPIVCWPETHPESPFPPCHAPSTWAMHTKKIGQQSRQHHNMQPG